MPWFEGKMNITLCSRCSGNNEYCEDKNIDIMVELLEFTLEGTRSVDATKIKNRDLTTIQINFQNNTKSFEEIVNKPNECFYIKKGIVEVYNGSKKIVRKFWNGDIETQQEIGLDYNNNQVMRDHNRLKDVVKNALENSIYLAYIALMVSVQERLYQNVLFDKGNIWTLNQLRYNKDVQNNNSLNPQQKAERILPCGTKYGVTSRFFYLRGFAIPINKINFMQAMVYGLGSYPYSSNLPALNISMLSSHGNGALIQRFANANINVTDAETYSFISFFLWFYAYYSGHVNHVSRIISGSGRPFYAYPSYEAIGIYAKAVVDSSGEGQQGQFQSTWHKGWAHSAVVGSVIAYKYIFTDNVEARKKTTFSMIQEAANRILKYAKDSTILASDNDRTKKFKGMVCTICRSVEEKTKMHPYKPIKDAVSNLLTDFTKARNNHNALANNNPHYRLSNYKPDSSNIFAHLTAAAWYNIAYLSLSRNDPALIPIVKEIFEALLNKVDEYETAAYNKLRTEYNL